MPPPFGVLGIRTIYLPAIEIKVLNAAPFCPLSSFKTCIKITWLGFITSWILYLLDLNLVSGFLPCNTGEGCSLSSSTWVVSVIGVSLPSVIWSFVSNSDSSFTSTGSLISRLPSLIFFCSSSSLFFNSSSLAFSSSSFIFAKSLWGIW